MAIGEKGLYYLATADPRHFSQRATALFATGKGRAASMTILNDARNLGSLVSRWYAKKLWCLARAHGRRPVMATGARSLARRPAGESNGFFVPPCSCHRVPGRGSVVVAACASAIFTMHLYILQAHYYVLIVVNRCFVEKSRVVSFANCSQNSPNLYPSFV